MKIDNRTSWLALMVLCAGDLMIVLDTTIVNVALPSIREDLGFSETSLAWVVNAYMLTFGGFLLLGGRLGDLFGHRRLFLIGIVALHARVARLRAREVAGDARSRPARCRASAARSSRRSRCRSIMTLFTEPAERAKAMGVFGFVASGGGSVGVVLGGVLTDALDWHWIFLVNLPIGVAVVALALRLLPAERGPRATAARRRRRGHRHRRAHARGLRDRQRQRRRLDVARRRSACSARRPCCSPSFIVDRGARRARR